MKLEQGNIYGFYIGDADRETFVKKLEYLCKDIEMEDYEKSILRYPLMLDKDECSGIVILLREGRDSLGVLYVGGTTYFDGHLEQIWPNIIHLDITSDGIRPYHTNIVHTLV